MTFFSPGQRLNETVIRQFFDVAKFQQVMARIESGTLPYSGGTPHHHHKVAEG